MGPQRCAIHEEPVAGWVIRGGTIADDRSRDGIRGGTTAGSSLCVGSSAIRGPLATHDVIGDPRSADRWVPIAPLLISARGPLGTDRPTPDQRSWTARYRSPLGSPLVDGLLITQGEMGRSRSAIAWYLSLDP